jgi:hypothetical protein
VRPSTGPPLAGWRWSTTTLEQWRAGVAPQLDRGQSREITVEGEEGRPTLACSSSRGVVGSGRRGEARGVEEAACNTLKIPSL